MINCPVETEGSGLSQSCQTSHDSLVVVIIKVGAQGYPFPPEQLFLRLWRVSDRSALSSAKELIRALAVLFVAAVTFSA